MTFDAYYLDWLNLVLRWAHVITGIAWIGSSFYFIWLDARLNVPPRDPENAEVAGDLWAVHGGGFYHSQKYKIAPAQLPEPLHWFKWEAYFTWMTGFALFIVMYYLNAGTLLVDAGRGRLAAAPAVIVSAALVIGGWLVYGGLNRLLSGGAFVAVGAALLLTLCWGVAQLFTGRGAYMQVGVMLGTIMAANVFFVIIPAQKQLVAAKLAGQPPDAQLGERAKQRSVHNNYLTLPVVFAMVSPHFPFTYAHRYNWLLLFVIFVGGALVRHWFNLRNRGRRAPWLPAAVTVLLIALVVVLQPRGAGQAPEAAGVVEFAHVRRIIEDRCVACHAAKTTHPTAPVAAAGVMLDSPQQVRAWAQRIHERAVVTRTMPLANLTGMTDEERATLGQWYAAGAPAD